MQAGLHAHFPPISVVFSVAFHMECRQRATFVFYNERWRIGNGNIVTVLNENAEKQRLFFVLSMYFIIEAHAYQLQFATMYTYNVSHLYMSMLVCVCAYACVSVMPDMSKCYFCRFVWWLQIEHMFLCLSI